ncbi:MAG: XTP/dITP diphosphatase [Promethearchaeota archaeon]
MSKKKIPIYFITGNDHKFKEILSTFQLEVDNYELIQSRIKTREIQASTIKEVAEFKINSVKDKIQESFFIEDAGFFVEEPLNGFPGVYSSYVFKTIGNEGILKLIGNTQDSIARFEAVIALYHAPTQSIKYFKGEVNGSISSEMRGDKGFGFDPIFIPNDIPNKTFSELTTQEKNSISHRGRALVQLIDFLRK